MTPINLLILLARCDSDAIVLVEALETNAVCCVLQVKYNDDTGFHKFVYICDDASYVKESLSDDEESGRIHSLVMEDIH